MIHGAVKPQTKPWRIHCRFYLHSVTMVSLFIISAFTSEWGIFTFSCSDWLLSPLFFSPVDATACSYNPCKSSPINWKPQAWQPWPAVGGCPGLPAHSLPLCSSLRDAVTPWGGVAVPLRLGKQRAAWLCCHKPDVTPCSVFLVQANCGSHGLVWKRSGPCPAV